MSMADDPGNVQPAKFRCVDCGNIYHENDVPNDFICMKRDEEGEACFGSIEEFSVFDYNPEPEIER